MNIEEAEARIDDLFERLIEECEGEDLMVVVTACTVMIADSIEEMTGDKSTAIESVRNAVDDLEALLDVPNNTNIKLH